MSKHQNRKLKTKCTEKEKWTKKSERARNWNQWVRTKLKGDMFCLFIYLWKKRASAVKISRTESVCLDEITDNLIVWSSPFLQVWCGVKGFVPESAAVSDVCKVHNFLCHARFAASQPSSQNYASDLLKFWDQKLLWVCLTNLKHFCKLELFIQTKGQ